MFQTKLKRKKLEYFCNCTGTEYQERTAEMGKKTISVGHGIMKSVLVNY